MISPTRIKAILFDLDGTLRHHLPTGREVFTKYAVSLGLPISEEDDHRAARWEHYYFANSFEIRSDKDKFLGQKFENEGFWVNFARRRLVALGCSPDRAAELAPQFSAYMQKAYQPQVHVPPEAPAILTGLKEAGYVLGMVSNRDTSFDAQLEEMGLRACFHFTLAAGEINAFKPEPAIFAEALRRAGSLASETMYVGDNYFADVIGSRRAGLLPVLYDPQRVFPDADCPVIHSFRQLTALL